MKAYWLTVGVGVFVTAIGGVVYTMSDQKLGVLLALGGMTVAIVGLMMRLAMVFMGDKAK